MNNIRKEGLFPNILNYLYEESDYRPEPYFKTLKKIGFTKEEAFEEFNNRVILDLTDEFDIEEAEYMLNKLYED